MSTGERFNRCGMGFQFHAVPKMPRCSGAHCAAFSWDLLRLANETKGPRREGDLKWQLLMALRVTTF